MGFHRQENYVPIYRLSLAQNQASAIKWLIICGQALGAAPVMLTTVSLPPTKFKSQPTWARCAFRILHFAWILTVYVLIVYSMVTRAMEHSHMTIAALLDIVEYIFNLINTTIVLVGCQWQSQCFGRFFDEFVDIDVRIQSVGGRAFPCTLAGLLRPAAILFVIFVICSVTCDFFFRMFEFYKVFRSIFVYLIPNVIVVLSVMQYLCVLHAICNRYTQICFVLRRLLAGMRVQSLSRNVNGTAPSPMMKMMHASGPPRGSGSVGRRKIGDQPPKMSICSDGDVEDCLELLRGVFQELNLLHVQANESFGLLIISLFAGTFVVVCTQLYTFYTLQMDGVQTAREISLATYSGLWVVLHSGRVFFILYFNTKAEDEVRKN